jgi:uncharacterized DUF497 family protein
VRVGYRFRWNAWNRAKVADHNLTPEETEFAVTHARRPWPHITGERKRLVWGQTASGDYLQVVYVLEEDKSVFVVHARPLRDHEKRRMRRRLR